MKVMYYIAIVPPPDLRKEIREFKIGLRDRYNAVHALRSPAHITLQMPFHFEENAEHLLEASLEGLASGHTSFSCELRDFGHFGKGVLFIEVVPNESLGNLRNKLQALLREQYHFGDRKLPERFHPHITIANRDLSPGHYNLAWAHFKELSYHKKFTAEALTLLKHGGDHWDVYREFPFREA
jgi:2'-5' RNA ligase